MFCCCEGKYNIPPPPTPLPPHAVLTITYFRPYRLISLERNIDVIQYYHLSQDSGITMLQVNEFIGIVMSCIRIALKPLNACYFCCIFGIAIVVTFCIITQDIIPPYGLYGIAIIGFSLFGVIAPISLIYWFRHRLYRHLQHILEEKNKNSTSKIFHW